MKDTKKKVTKALAREIAAKFFGRTVKLVEDVDPTKRRVFYSDGYIFKSGAVMLDIFPYYSGAGKDFEYPNEYPYGQIVVQGCCIGDFKYVDGEFETENILHNEYEELRDTLRDISGLLEDTIDENKIDKNSDFLDKWIVKDKTKLLRILKLSKAIEDKYC